MAEKKTSEQQSLKDVTVAADLQPETVQSADQGKTVKLTSAAGTKVTAPESMAASLKAAGYK